MILGFKLIHPATGKPTRFPIKINEGIKIHTIREGYRWEEGFICHCATGVRTKNYSCFRITECKGTQGINIMPYGNDDGLIMVDGKGLNQYTKSLLATNDGFDSIEDFWAWFKKPVDGQIIHFTDYRY